MVHHCHSAGAAALTLLLGFGGGAVRAGAPGAHADALEVLADLTLIDGACHNVTVNFGAGFRFAGQEGVTPAAVLPGGPQRPAFERVLRERRASFGPDELCGEIADNYAEALPGSITPSFRRGMRP